MKKKILVIMAIIVIFWVGFYFYGKSLFFKENSHSSDLALLSLVNMQITYPKKEVEDFDVKEYNEEEARVVYAEIPFKNFFFLENYQNNNKKLPGLLSIYVTKNANKDELSIDDWLAAEGNNLESDKQSPKSYKQENIEISNKKGVKNYFAPVDGRVNFSLYELITLYIPNKTDIYEINYYKLPINPDPLLTPEYIKNAENYEKVTDEIIQSIRFVE